MPYSWKTFGASKTDLAGRLGDVSQIYWLNDELGRYIKESLRTFNSIAQIHRTRCNFNTQNGIAFYDITQAANPNSLTGGSGALVTNPPAFLGYSIKDRDLINDIEYHLLEPITTGWGPIVPTLTDQFTMNDFTRAIERRRNQFLLLVSLNLSHSQVPYNSPSGDGRVPLSDQIIYVRRVAWKNFDGLFTPLWRDDEESANFLNVNWANNPAIPITYSVYLTPVVGIQLIPPSNDIGTLDLITQNNPGDLNEAVGVLLNIPDDFAWILKWGALADLFSKDTQASDPFRYEYCQKRFEEGVRLALASPTIQNVVLDGITVQPSSFEDFDAMLSGWQNQSGTPTDVAIAGRNLIALSPVPDAGPHSVQLDVVRNMPIPSVDGDFLQIGKEHYDTILEYATHLAMFKDEGPEFESTIPLVNSFMSVAMQHNAVLRAEARDYDVMQGYSLKEMIDRPRLESSERAA